MISEVSSSLCDTQQFTSSLLEWLLNSSLGLLGVSRVPSKYKLLFKVGGIIKRTIQQFLLEAAVGFLSLLCTLKECTVV